MKLEFKLNSIKLVKEDKIVESVTTENIDNDNLYKLILKCSDADHIDFIIDDSADPFTRKLYEILKREFENK